jgi:FkbM family methyltransferase
MCSKDLTDSMKAFIKEIFERLGYRIQGIRYTPKQLLDSRKIRAVEFDDIISRRMLERGNELTFIQIGAFDGITNDPLRKYIHQYGWKGVLLEPQTRAAMQLRKLYEGNSRIKILQAALDREHTSRELFFVDSTAVPVWAGGLASFDKNSIMKNAGSIPGLEQMIKSETVKCIPFGDVLTQVEGGSLDLLQIDAEGADALILSYFPFHQVRPAIIHWEVKHLTRVQQEETFDMLSKFRYRFARSGGEDMIAVNDG